MRKRPLLCVTITLMTLVLLSPAPGRAAEKALLFLPLALHVEPSRAEYLRPGLRSMFLSRLPGDDIAVIPQEALTPLLTERERSGVASADRAGELARALKADFAVFGSLSALGPNYSLDLAVLDTARGPEHLTRIAEVMSEDQLIPKMDDIIYQVRAAVAGIDIRPQPAASTGAGGGQQGLFHRIDTGEANFEPKGRVSMRMEILSLDAGDLDGDGTTEVAVLAKDTLVLYRSREGTLARVGSLDASLGEVFFKVSMGDGDGDGLWELYVASHNGNYARTTLYRWDGGAFKRIARHRGHLQAARDPSGLRTWILFQDSQMDRFFFRDIHRVTVDGAGSLIERTPLPGLEEAQFYTLRPRDVDGVGGPGFVGLNEGSRLTVWGKGGEVLWKDDESTGGTNNDIFLESKGPARMTVRLAFNSRIAFADIDKDGTRELVVPDNTSLVGGLERFKLYTKGRLKGYAVQGAGLKPALSTRSIRYCITDIQSVGPALYVAAQEPKISKIGSGTSRILWFE